MPEQFERIGDCQYAIRIPSNEGAHEIGVIKRYRPHCPYTLFLSRPGRHRRVQRAAIRRLQRAYARAIAFSIFASEHYHLQCSGTPEDKIIITDADNTSEIILEVKPTWVLTITVKGRMSKTCEAALRDIEEELGELKSRKHIPEKQREFKLLEKYFPCKLCGRFATKITLLPTAVPHPKSGSTELKWLGLADPLPPSQVGAPAMVVQSVACGLRWALEQPKFEQVYPLVESGNSDALFQLDCEYLPSYCYPCSCHYCADHWVSRIEFDDGFYDCTVGFCPQGHRRLLDD